MRYHTSRNATLLDQAAALVGGASEPGIDSYCDMYTRHIWYISPYARK